MCVWVYATPQPPLKETQYPSKKGLGGSEGRYSWAPTGNDPRTAYRVASHYTDRAIPAHNLLVSELNACLIS
jgi:hypothetical protein